MVCFQREKNTVKRTGNVAREIDEQVFVVNLQSSSLRGEHLRSSCVFDILVD